MKQLMIQYFEGQPMVAEDVSTDFDKNLTVQDRIRLHLGKYGQKSIPITIEKLAQEVGLPENSVYQAINRFRQNGELDIEKTSLPNGREKIIGLTLRKLQPSGRTYRRAAERSGKVIRINPDKLPPAQKGNDLPAIPNLTDYLHKKFAIEEMREKALKAGLDESVISFQENPIAEEGLLLLKRLTDLQKQHAELTESYQRRTFDWEAEKRNVEYLKEKAKAETRNQLRLYKESS